MTILPPPCCSDPAAYKLAEDICVQMGQYFQVGGQCNTALPCLLFTPGCKLLTLAELLCCSRSCAIPAPPPSHHHHKHTTTTTAHAHAHALAILSSTTHQTASTNPMHQHTCRADPGRLPRLLRRPRGHRQDRHRHPGQQVLLAGGAGAGQGLRGAARRHRAELRKGRRGGGGGGEGGVPPARPRGAVQVGGTGEGWLGEGKNGRGEGTWRRRCRCCGVFVLEGRAQRSTASCQLLLLFLLGFGSQAVRAGQPRQAGQDDRRPGPAATGSLGGESWQERAKCPKGRGPIPAMSCKLSSSRDLHFNPCRACSRCCSRRSTSARSDSSAHPWMLPPLWHCCCCNFARAGIFTRCAVISPACILHLELNLRV